MFMMLVNFENGHSRRVESTRSGRSSTERGSERGLLELVRREMRDTSLLSLPHTHPGRSDRSSPNDEY